MEVRTRELEFGYGIDVWAELGQGTERVAAIGHPVALEILTGQGSAEADMEHLRSGYDRVEDDAGSVIGTALIRIADQVYELRDRWTPDADIVALDRRLTVVRAGAGGSALRMLLDAELVLSGRPGFDSFTWFAPSALYDMNDIDGDGVEDYLDTRELLYRDDRLTCLTVLAYLPEREAGLALSRQDLPEFDDVPDRERGQRHFGQRTDVGSLGLRPGADDEAHLVAAYPFTERSRSHALTSEGREPWGAFWPAGPGDVLDVSYALQLVSGGSATEALWALWRRRLAHLRPRRVELTETIEDITRLRLDALLPYYAELPGNSPVPAGFVTNCHPQDGVQLQNVIQYGFTGQNVLNALHVLRYAGDDEDEVKALRVIDFFVALAGRSQRGLVHTLFNLDTGKAANWWSGLLLPLAYADDGTDLEALMGPVYEHMRYAIEALDQLDGTYLRCLCEEYTALLRAYQAELERGRRRDDWLDVSLRFGEFLLAAQEDDGSWRRAYGFDGEPISRPTAWFGETALNQKSSTATAVPVLVHLHRLTGDDRWLHAAVRAGEFVATHVIADLKFNGGIHDSIYSRPQLVDSECILFAMRAVLMLAQHTDDEAMAAAAADAARVLCTWVYLWDVPLPPESTLARHGFRSTGWSACDTCGAGYVHPYELHAVPDLFQIAIHTEDSAMATVADLVLHGSSETVATSTRDWGYARAGLQEEGLLVSWWLMDDPMFTGTSFGGRGKGEGNKTCLPWISAVGIDVYSELIDRFGTADLPRYWRDNVAPAEAHAMPDRSTGASETS